MKKYVTLKCSVCKRTRDELVDVKHYTTDRCTITLGCEGRLLPLGYTDDGSNTIGVPPAGLSNWYPRGSKITKTVELKPETFYNTSTGKLKQLVVAVKFNADFVPSADAYLSLNLETEAQSTKDYRQYVYRKIGVVQIVNGIEDGQSKKVLRYSLSTVNPDQVEVFVNGVKKNRGPGPDDYQLFGGDSPAPPNSVFFNTPLIGPNTQVDVIVTKAATLSTAQIRMSRATDDESRIGTGAWEGVDSVSTTSGKWYLFFADITEMSPPLPIDTKLRLSAAVPSIVVNGQFTTDIGAPASGTQLLATQKANAAILLSRENLFTPIDRQRSSWVPLFNLTENNGYLIMKLTAGERTLFLTEDSVEVIFPLLTVNRFDPPSLLKTGLLGNNDAAEIDSIFIVGPDA